MDYSANASIGHDDVILGGPGDSSPLIEHQIIEGFASKHFHLGTFGLSPHAVNLSDTNHPQPSLLSALAQQNVIPSLSWAYTAGSYTKVPTAFGSLTLGGYDAARFVPNNLTFPFSSDPSRDLLVGIQTITTDLSPTALLPGSVYASIDYLVPHIWLPVESCRAFERGFGIQYNETAERYYVNDTLHQALLQSNPNVTLSLGYSAAKGSSIRIRMPYSSFDNSASPSIPGNPPRTFPLRRAANDSQITLGRAFWQDAYVIADYERSSFSVSQVVHPNTSYVPRLVSIWPPWQPISASPTPRNSLSKPAIAGIVVCACLALAVLLSASTWYLIRKRRQPCVASEPSTEFKSELDGKNVASREVFEMPLPDPKELTDESRAKLGHCELPGSEALELASKQKPATELLGSIDCEPMELTSRATLHDESAKQHQGLPKDLHKAVTKKHECSSATTIGKGR